jgi:hypothetical protein
MACVIGAHYRNHARDEQKEVDACGLARGQAARRKLSILLWRPFESFVNGFLQLLVAALGLEPVEEFLKPIEFFLQFLEALIGFG